MTKTGFPAQEISQGQLIADKTEDGVLLKIGDTICGLDVEAARQLCGWLVNAVGYYSATADGETALPPPVEGDSDDALAADIRDDQVDEEQRQFEEEIASTVEELDDSTETTDEPADSEEQSDTGDTLPDTIH